MNNSLELSILHFDMKALIPKANFLINLLPSISSMGYNAILVEFEDKFPYKSIPEIVHPDCWTIKEFTQLKLEAKKCNIQIIPLLQCAGHLDYVLKHKKFKHLREGDAPKDSTNEWCLKDNTEPLAIFKSMAQELLDFFPDSKYFHIGADEYNFSHQCSKCANSDKFLLYLNHVEECRKFIASHDKEVVLWDDVFRKRNHPKLDKLLSKVIPCIWQYTTVDEKIIQKMCQIAPVVWSASKIQNEPFYRGLGAQDKVMDNVDLWAKMHEKYPIKGHIATIWGRNHGLSPLAQTLVESFYMIGYQGYTNTYGLISNKEDFRKYFAQKYFNVNDIPFVDYFHYNPQKVTTLLEETLKIASQNQGILKVWQNFNSIDELWTYCDMCFGSNMALYKDYINMVAPDDMTYNFLDGVKITKEKAKDIRNKITSELEDIFMPILLQEYLSSRLDGMLATNNFWEDIITKAIAGKKL